jgi:predicted adenine nucleotide alpha hydrolase (AANH) superfamily ATPase
MSNKLRPKSDKCFFIGYPKETKDYYFYHGSDNKVFIARHGVFLEEEFLSKEWLEAMKYQEKTPENGSRP